CECKPCALMNPSEDVRACLTASRCHVFLLTPTATSNGGCTAVKDSVQAWMLGVRQQLHSSRHTASSLGTDEGDGPSNEIDEKRNRGDVGADGHATPQGEHNPSDHGENGKKHAE